TGGYHTRGITEILRNKGISYEVIRPIVNRSYNKEIYLKRIKEQAVYINKIKSGAFLDGLSYSRLIGELKLTPQFLSLFCGNTVYFYKIIEQLNKMGKQKQLEDFEKIIISGIKYAGGWGFFSTAADNEDIKTVKLLLKWGAKADDNELNLINKKIQNEQDPVKKHIMRYIYNLISQKQHTAKLFDGKKFIQQNIYSKEFYINQLHYAVLKNYKELTGFLIEDLGFDINEKLYRKEEVFSGVSLNIKNGDTFHVLVDTKKYLDVDDSLLVAVEELNYDALYIAILCGHYDMTELLLNAGAKIENYHKSVLKTEDCENVLSKIGKRNEREKIYKLIMQLTELKCFNILKESNLKDMLESAVKKRFLNVINFLLDSPLVNVNYRIMVDTNGGIYTIREKNYYLALNKGDKFIQIEESVISKLIYILVKENTFYIAGLLLENGMIITDKDLEELNKVYKLQKATLNKKNKYNFKGIIKKAKQQNKKFKNIIRDRLLFMNQIPSGAYYKTIYLELIDYISEMRKIGIRNTELLFNSYINKILGQREAYDNETIDFGYIIICFNGR
ncbi:hypothetical protein ACFL4O_02435, partial [bacterium]